MSTKGIPFDRRVFLRQCGRLALLGIGGAGLARLYRRGQIQVTSQTCTHRGICSSCPAYAGCGLPPALSRRRALESRS